MTREEFIQAIPHIRKGMLRIATNMLGKNGGVEDAVQDALLKLFLDYKKIEVTALRIYSRIVLINVCKDNLKYKERHKTCSIEELLDEFSVIDDDIESLKMLEKQCSGLMRVIQKIPSRQKMLIELVYFKKLDVKTISKTTGMSVANIHKNISRTRIKLLRILSSLGLLVIVIAFLFDFVNNRLEKSVAPVNAPVAEAEKPVVRRQEAETVADTSRSEGGEAVAFVPVIAETESPEVLRCDSVPDKISVCYSFDDEDIVLMASLSIEKTDDGKYLSRLCNYSLVSGEGDNVVFMPSAEMYSGLDSSDFKIRISGILVFESPEGKTFDRDILIEKEMF